MAPDYQGNIGFALQRFDRTCYQIQKHNFCGQICEGSQCLNATVRLEQEGFTGNLRLDLESQSSLYRTGHESTKIRVIVTSVKHALRSTHSVYNFLRVGNYFEDEPR